MATPVTIDTYTIDAGVTITPTAFRIALDGLVFRARPNFGEVKLQFDASDSNGEIYIYTVGYAAHRLVPRKQPAATPCAVCDFPVTSDVHR